MKNRPKMLNERKPGYSDAVALIFFCILIALLSFDLFFVKNFFVVEVDGESMLDTLLDADFLYASHIAEPERGDIVVVDVTGYAAFAETERNPDGRALIIKRLIAVEGDTVKCENGRVYLKKAGEEEFAALGEEYLNPAYVTYDFGPVKVGEGQIFVLGDHRNRSKDSRDAGCLSAADIEGVVPNWAVAHKSLITAWEGFRTALIGKIFGR